MQKSKVIKVAKLVGTWIPAVLLALIFAPQGWAKFDDASGWGIAFRHWGYPAWFRVTVGITELSAVALLLLGRTAAYGAILILLVMLGAWGTHIMLDNGQHMTSEVVPIVLASLVLALRRQQLRRAPHAA